MDNDKAGCFYNELFLDKTTRQLYSQKTTRSFHTYMITLPIKKIQHFTHLYAWQKNHELVLKIYKLTKKFPKDELFGLTSQIRRAVVSITSNIAEEYGRFHYGDKTRFYIIARGSSAEVQNHLIIAKDLKYITKKEFDEIKVVSYEGYKIICGLIQSTDKTRKQ